MFRCLVVWMVFTGDRQTINMSKHQRMLCASCCLLLVAAASSATASTLEFTALGSDIWACVRMWHTWSLTEVLVGHTCGTFALQQHCTLAGWRANGQLIEGQHFTALLEDAATSLFGHMQSAQFDAFRDTQLANVIGDCANNDNNAVLVFSGASETNDSLQRNWWLIGAAHKQAFQDDFVELLVCPAVQETVQLYCFDTDERGRDKKKKKKIDKYQAFQPKHNKVLNSSVLLPAQFQLHFFSALGQCSANCVVLLCVSNVMDIVASSTFAELVSVIHSVPI